MRAFFTLIFFTLVLACGLLMGFLYSKTGLPVPYIGDQLEALIPENRGTKSKIALLERDLSEQTGIAKQLETALQNSQSRLEELRGQNEQLQQALNPPVAAGIQPSLASGALTNDLIEQNQYLTEELSLILNEKAALEGQFAAVRTELANVKAAQAAGTGSAGSAATGEEVAALQQQVSRLLGERNNLTQTLTEALKQKDIANVTLQNIQSQYQSVLASLQSNGGDVGRVLENAGVDLEALAEGQSGRVLQNLIQGLGN